MGKMFLLVFVMLITIVFNFAKAKADEGITNKVSPGYCEKNPTSVFCQQISPYICDPHGQCALIQQTISVNRDVASEKKPEVEKSQRAQ